jgi:hypothetical protein
MNIRPSHTIPLYGALLLLWGAAACNSGGVQVRLRLDELTTAIDADSIMNDTLRQFSSLGVLSFNSAPMPELWPSSMPAVTFKQAFTSPPIVLDLTPPPGSPDEEKYASVNQAAGLIRRIEVNRLVLRVEENTLTTAIPALTVQVADDMNASPDDRQAWRTIGTVPGASPGFIGDLEFVYHPGGESFLVSQLSDDTKELAVRAKGTFEINTDQNPRLPAGKASVRLIIVATFLVDAAKAAGSL